MQLSRIFLPRSRRRRGTARAATRTQAHEHYRRGTDCGALPLRGFRAGTSAPGRAGTRRRGSGPRSEPVHAA